MRWYLFTSQGEYSPYILFSINNTLFILVLSVLPWYNLNRVKFTLFSCTLWKVFIILYSTEPITTQNYDRIFPSPPKISFVPFYSQSPPQQPALGATICFCLYIFAFCRLPYKINNKYIIFSVYFFSLNLMFLKFIHSLPLLLICFLLWQSSTSLYKYN